MKYLTVLLLLLAQAGAGSRQSEYHFNRQASKVAGSRIQANDSIPLPIPPGHFILDSASADLNNDGYTDLLVIAAIHGEDTLSSPDLIKRPLILFLRDKHGRLKPALQNENAILCAQCGGVYGDPYAGMELRTGRVVLSMYGGSNWRWSIENVFVYSASLQTWYLAEQTEESFNVMEPDKVERITRDSTQLGGITLGEYNIYRDTD